MNIDLLFEKLNLKDLYLENRIVMAPMTRAKAPENRPNDDTSDYYESRAKGGVGLIISEGSYINLNASESGFSDPTMVPNFFGSEALSGWKMVVEAVHKHGTKFIPQLWHVGSVRQTGMNPEPEKSGFAPSSVLNPNPGASKGDLPRVMTEEDIENIINDYTNAAIAAKNIGCDGIELHGAHGYLIDQFFWDYTNKRQDVYGGSISARTKFACDIVKSIRSKIGNDFPIGLRFSQWKIGAYKAKIAYNPRELEAFLIPLVNAGVDLFHCSTRDFAQAEFDGSHLNLAGWTKKITGKTVITVGSVGTNIDFIDSYLGKRSHDKSNLLNALNLLCQQLENKEVDLVAIGRALIADSAFTNKIKEHKFTDIISYTPEMLNSYP